MKYKICWMLLFLTLFLSNSLLAQPSTFSIFLGDTSDNMYVTDFAQVDPNTYWLLGMKGNTSFLAAFDQHGQMQWAHQQPNLIAWNQLVPCPSGDVYAVGRREAVPFGSSQLVVGYFDPNGVNQWTMMLDTANWHFAGNSSLLGNGNLIVTGTKEDGGLSPSGYVCVLEPNGNIVWEQAFDGGRYCSAIGFGPNEAFVTLCDTFLHSDLIRLGPTGNVRWAKRLDLCQATGLTLQGDSLLYIASNAWGMSLSASITVLDTAGNFRWASDLGGLQGTQSITFLNSNRLLLSGTIFVPDFMDPHQEGSLAFYDFNTNTYAPTGNHRWYHGGRSNLYMTQDGGYITASMELTSTYDLYLEKFDTNLTAICLQPSPWPGNVNPFTVVPTPINITPFTATAHAGLGATSAVAYNLPMLVNCSTVGISDPPETQLTAWPNPSMDIVRLEWPREAMVASEIRMELWSSDGRLVLAQMIENTGANSCSLGDFPTGAYFLRLRSDNFALGQTLIKD